MPKVRKQYAHPKKDRLPCTPTGYYVYKTGKYTPAEEDRKHDKMQMLRLEPERTSIRL